MTSTNKPCKIRSCDEPARWLVVISGHPNGDGDLRTPYCHQHAEAQVGLLWDESPSPYTTTAIGPYPNGVPA